MPSVSSPKTRRLPAPSRSSGAGVDLARELNAPRDDSDLVFESLFGLSRSLHLELNRRHAEHGLTFERARLLCAIEAEPGLAQATYAKQLCLPETLVSRGGRKLVAAGLISRSRDVGNGRVHRLFRTNVEPSLVQSLHNLQNEILDKAFRGIPPEALQDVVNLASHMRATLGSWVPCTVQPDSTEWLADGRPAHV